ncbi:hypothetical protein B0J12DRAFT_230971 [Macrophomina phaseolina]|uniref:Uncharacterized protein n=1 Tax=Macrophomina phaseolina TaxID=35725 RepID=A0ABQ8GPW6_9PEZI|nr:hypothetical protein B0J12DRAFT_230971 [Macrophomina phaseolina]
MNGKWVWAPERVQSGITRVFMRHEAFTGGFQWEGKWATKGTRNGAGAGVFFFFFHSFPHHFVLAPILTSGHGHVISAGAQAVMGFSSLLLFINDIPFETSTRFIWRFLHRYFGILTLDKHSRSISVPTSSRNCG